MGASSVTVAKHYRVIDVHNKYYNKWFMSKVPSKKWNKDLNSILNISCRRLMGFKSMNMSTFMTNSIKRDLLYE